MNENTRGSARSRTAAVGATLREAVSPGRLLFVAKTAVAVGAAWLVAPLMPGVTDEYPYYAPLGALISMYPTLMGSARSGLQTLLGVATGIGLAALVIVTVGPNWWSIPLVVGLGVLVSGTGWFGAGAEYVSIAALFVLIIGGQNADAYSLGYAAQMGVGVAIGLLVNVLVPPATFVTSANASVEAFQHGLASHLRNVGLIVAEPEPPAHAVWAADAEALAGTARTVRDALGDADRSMRGNPRAWIGRRSTREIYERLDELDQITHHIREISECLADAVWERPTSLPLAPELAAPAAAACEAVADVIDRSRAGTADEHRARGEAARAVRLLLQAVDDRTLDVRSAMGPGVLTAMHLRRILVLTGGAAGKPKSAEPA